MRCTIPVSMSLHFIASLWDPSIWSHYCFSPLLFLERAIRMYLVTVRDHHLLFIVLIVRTNHRKSSWWTRFAHFDVDELEANCQLVTQRLNECCY